MLLRLRGRLQALLLQARQDEMIDLVARPTLALHPRRGRAFRWQISPMLLELGPFGDPATEQLKLLFRHVLAGFFGRHFFILIRGDEHLDQPALLQITGDHREGAGLELARGLLASIQAQPSLALVLVRTMTGKAFIGEDRADVLIEIDWLLLHRLAKT